MPVPLIAVVGPSQATNEQLEAAEEVGRLLGMQGYGIVTGGHGGVMEAASRGCAEAGGVVVGLLPGLNPGEANPYVGVAIATGLAEARNTLVVRSAMAVIAIGGGYGTLSEVGFALKIGRRVIGLNTFVVYVEGRELPGLVRAQNPAEAVRLAVED